MEKNFKLSEHKCIWQILSHIVNVNSEMYKNTIWGKEEEEEEENQISFSLGGWISCLSQCLRQVLLLLLLLFRSMYDCEMCVYIWIQVRMHLC